MTTQVNLGKIWANTGGVTDPGDIKYTNGWISEIPTYQNFNFVLQNNSKNLLVAAEGSGFDWQGDINYIPGAIVRSGGKKYYCHLVNINQDPAGDSTNSYWTLSESWGETHTYSAKAGAVNNVMFTRGPDLWLGQDQTIINTDNSFVLFADKSIRTNILLGMSNGELITKQVGNVIEPDGQNIHPDSGGNRIFHEGHPPIQSEVAGTIPEAPDDSFIYGRAKKGWIAVSGVDGLQAFPSGTRMLFSQASAPTAWTQDVSDTASNRMLRVTNAIGGGVGGEDDPLLDDKVGSHIHDTAVNFEGGEHKHGVAGTSNNNDKNHTHVVAGNTGSQSKNHTHYCNLDTGNLASDGNHFHELGRAAGSYLGSGAITTGDANEGYFKTDSDGYHHHDVKGNTNSQSTSHTHYLSIGSGVNSTAHKHSFNVTSGAATSRHWHTGITEFNTNKVYNWDFTQEGGGSGTVDQTNTGTWVPRYLNIIICTAN